MTIVDGGDEQSSVGRKSKPGLGRIEVAVVSPP